MLSLLCVRSLTEHNTCTVREPAMPANHREMQFSKTSINGRGCATIAAAPAEYFGSCEGVICRYFPTWVTTSYRSAEASCQSLRRKRNGSKGPLTIKSNTLPEGEGLCGTGCVAGLPKLMRGTEPPSGVAARRDSGHQIRGGVLCRHRMQKGRGSSLMTGAVLNGGRNDARATRR